MRRKAPVLVTLLHAEQRVGMPEKRGVISPQSVAGQLRSERQLEPHVLPVENRRLAPRTLQTGRSRHARNGSVPVATHAA